MTRSSDGRETRPVAVHPQPVPVGAGLDHPSLYFNRELSWLDFNWRVLHQAGDERLPLLERVRFVSISCGNLDEFFQKRVGGLMRQATAGLTAPSLDGRPPSSQLQLIREAAALMQRRMTELWEDVLRPRLQGEADIVIWRYQDLDRRRRDALDAHFREHVYPILTPLGVDPGRPFPFISNLSLSLAIQLRHSSRETTHFVRVKVPLAQGRWLPVPGPNQRHFLPLEELVRHNVHELFPGLEVVSVHAFRVTRNADIRRDDDETEDLLALVSEELRERRFAPVVRLEIEAGTSEEVVELLQRELELGPSDTYPVQGLLGLDSCDFLANLDIPEHCLPPWEPVTPLVFQASPKDGAEPSIFSILRQGDVLVHHPYDSFATSVQRFVEEAADDPAVVAIKQTLYRTSDNSPIVRALMRAAERGKQVAVLVELTARFEEARNIEWAQVLEDAGVHVTYGLVGLKTHAKVVLVVRYEGEVPSTYCHLGTGNYHLRTARQYTDLGLLTCDREIGRDVVNLFHFLTGYAPDQTYQTLVVAPRDMRARFVELIRREVRAASEGDVGRIIAKMNALDDPEIIQELYSASQAGVRIDLLVRGHCRLRPGLRPYSENIRVRSLVGRFLEHDRIFFFHNGGDPEILIGSADWRERNLDRRVETLVPVRTPALRDRLRHLLELALADNRLAWELSSDGSYRQLHPAEGQVGFDFHAALMQDALERAGGTMRPWRPGGD